MLSSYYKDVYDCGRKDGYMDILKALRSLELSTDDATAKLLLLEQELEKVIAIYERDN